MRKASTKDILRTVWKEKKRFISIMMITVLGVTLMTGLKAGCRDLKLSADRFYDSQNLFDISIMSTLGLTKEDVLVMQSLEEVEKAEGTFTEIVHTKNGDINRTAEVKIVRENGLNIPYVINGRLPETAKEIAVNETYLKDTGKVLGDTLIIEEIFGEEDKVSEEGDKEDNSLDIDSEVELEEKETPNFPNTEFTIVGTVIDVTDINNAEGSAAFRATPNADYTFFVTPLAVKSEVYTAIYLTLKGSEELLCYSLEYQGKTESVTEWIESRIMEQRELARYQEITGVAYQKIAEKEGEMYDTFEDIEKEFADAEVEIADARKELDDGWKDVHDGWKELEDGRKELEEGRKELEEGRQELNDGWKELEDGIRELEEGRQELEDGKQKLADAEKEAKEEIAKARKQLEDAHGKLMDGFAQIDAAEKELNEGAAKLEAGKQELIQKEEAGKKQLEEGKKKLQSSINENKEQKKKTDTSLQQMKKMFGETWQDGSSLNQAWNNYIA